MKPTQLKPGQRVLITPLFGLKTPYHGTFIRRVPRQFGYPAYSIIRIADFAELDGSEDLGDTPFSDYAVVHQVQPLEARV
ncbi:hypothetical protein [Limnobaculum xujianqingii]|uniref:hypothetical protein n=1 Tax=Limnobaculum xujianqingii TaxID=2738837 RepID=UPI001125FD2F|nr:hypothetical protein [Limnobaculum xujianqingii]